jgi:hypothetical protein
MTLSGWRNGVRGSFEGREWLEIALGCSFLGSGSDRGWLGVRNNDKIPLVEDGG